MSSPLMVASNWEIGPVINGKDYSVGMPLNPTQTADGWSFDFPLQPGLVGYVTYRFGSLTGKTHIVIHYRIEADDGVELHPPSAPDSPAIGPTVYFQQKGDDWNTDGMRWWATFNTKLPMLPGDFELDIPLDGPWTSVQNYTAANNPSAFSKAKETAERIGFTFGGGTGFGHGTFATGRARFVLLSFRVE